MKYLHRKVARGCPIHTAVLETAVDQLVDFGVFSKDKVVDALNFGAIADSIRWDYIREFIQEEQGADLVPLASTYFKHHKATEERVNPARFIAQGNGKKTAGYAAVIPANDHLVIHRIKQRKAISNGVAESFHEYLDRLNAKRIDQGLLPVREQSILTEGE
jgi:hypothetical protein